MSTTQHVPNIFDAYTKILHEPMNENFQFIVDSLLQGAPSINYCNTRAEMKALPVTLIKAAFLNEAGRQGTFSLIAGAPPRTDTQEGVYIISNTPGYYWTRVYAPYNCPPVAVFGALGGANDDSVPIQASINVLDQVDLQTQSFWTFKHITLNTNQKMFSSTIAKVKAPTMTGDYCVRFVGFGIDVYQQIVNIEFDGAAADVTSSALVAGTSTGIVFGIRVEQCGFRNWGSVFTDEVHATNYIVDTYFKDCLIYLTRGRPIFNRRSRGFIEFDYVRVDYTYNTTQVDYNAFHLIQPVGVVFNQCEVTGPVIPTATYQPDAFAFLVVGTGGIGASVWFDQCEIDNTRGPGIYCSDLINVYTKNLVVYQNLGTAVAMVNITRGSMNQTNIFGGKGLPAVAANAQGITKTNCTNFNITDFEIANMTGDGVVDKDCTDNTTSIGVVSNCNGYAYRESGSATRNKRIGVTSTNNTLGSLLQLGAQSATYSWTPNSGIPTASTIGAATIA